VPFDNPSQRERLSPVGLDCRQPAISAQHGRLAFARASWDENIWRVGLAGGGRTLDAPAALTGSTRSELNAQFSPDGSRIVFESTRSGNQELWVADSDGQNALQLTALNGRVGGTPAWSPDGQSIAFDWRGEDGRGDIWVVSAHGGAPFRVTTHPADDLVPSWSRDGRSIRYGSTRTGRYEIWTVSPHGGEPVQLTRHGGAYGKESIDGYLYYAKIGDGFFPSLWRVPVSGGEEVRILPAIASYGNFAVAHDGIYFESPPPAMSLGHIPLATPFTPARATIGFYSFATAKVTRVIAVERHAGHGLDISPDGRTLMFAQMDAYTEDLLLVEKFLR
jgi:dipeptidyl aminopeptidase/acylaminoacyl peptidase